MSPSFTKPNPVFHNKKALAEDGWLAGVVAVATR